MALAFPTNPSLNDTYQGWYWNGSAWKLSTTSAVANARDISGHYTYWCPASVGTYTGATALAAGGTDLSVGWTTLIPVTPTVSDQRLTSMVTAAADPWLAANKQDFSLAGLPATGSAMLACELYVDFDQADDELDVRFVITPNGSAAFNLEAQALKGGAVSAGVFQAGAVLQPLTMSANTFGADTATAAHISIQARTGGTSEVLIGTIDYRFFT